MSNQDEFTKIFTGLRVGLKNVRIALWGEDYRLAHNFLYDLEQEYKKYLISTQNLRKDLTDIYKAERDSAKKEVSQLKDISKWEQELREEHLIEEKQLSSIYGRLLEYNLIPFQYEIERYRNRINKALKAHTEMDLPSDSDWDKFSNLEEYQISRYDFANVIKYRFYRFSGQIDISPKDFIQEIEKEFEGKTALVDSELKDSWDDSYPLCIRLFSTDYFIEITVFDAYRAEMIVTYHPDTLQRDLDGILANILEKKP